MKSKLLVLSICICAIYEAHSQSIDYGSVRTAIVEFMSETEADFNDRGADNILLIRDAVSNYQIGDERDYNYPDYEMGSEVKEGVYSIFPMSSFSEYTYTHLLLVDKNDFKIINMKESFRDNLKLIIKFLQSNPMYTKEAVILYLQDFIRVYEGNIP